MKKLGFGFSSSFDTSTISLFIKQYQTHVPMVRKLRDKGLFS